MGAAKLIGQERWPEGELLDAGQQVSGVSVADMAIYGRLIDTNQTTLVVHQNLTFIRVDQSECAPRKQQGCEGGHHNSTHIVIYPFDHFQFLGSELRPREKSISRSEEGKD